LKNSYKVWKIGIKFRREAISWQKVSQRGVAPADKEEFRSSFSVILPLQSAEFAVP
jgi:hypothetical protein